MGESEIDEGRSEVTGLFSGEISVRMGCGLLLFDRMAMLESS